jgi:hypothetical protein
MPSLSQRLIVLTCTPICAASHARVRFRAWGRRRMRTPSCRDLRTGHSPACTAQG